MPQIRKVMVAFQCDHPFEDRCNPRYCGSGHPYLAVIERSDEHVARGWAAPGAQRRQLKVEALDQLNTSRLPVPRAIVPARDLQPSDPQPSSIDFRLLLKAATHARYGVGVSAGDRLWCRACSSYQRVKKDGQLYTHTRIAIGGLVKCSGTDPDPQVDPQPVESTTVLLKGVGTQGPWAARWTNNAADGAWLHKVGRVTLARLRQCV